MNKARIITGLIVLAGIINFLPVIGAVSVAQIEGLYGVDASDPTLGILLRHRAVLFGLIGGFMIVAAFCRRLHLTAIIGGLISMLSFLWLYFLTGDQPQALLSIIYADIAGIAFLGGALIIKALARDRL